MITAIMFGSAARRCSGENIITRYQMTVLVRRFPAETLCSRTVAGAFSCGVRELKSFTQTVNATARTMGVVSHLISGQHLSGWCFHWRKI
jgi:hypothetical protein